MVVQGRHCPHCQAQMVYDMAQHGKGSNGIGAARRWVRVARFSWRMPTLVSHAP